MSKEKTLFCKINKPEGEIKHSNGNEYFLQGMEFFIGEEYKGRLEVLRLKQNVNSSRKEFRCD